MSVARLLATPAIAALSLLSGPARAIDFPTLAAALRDGGYILHVRPAPPQVSHVATSQRDACRDRSWLDPYARTQIRTLGAAIASLQIPVGDVLTGADCPSLQTARLAFAEAEAQFGAAVAPSPDALAPAPGTNLVVVAPGALAGGRDPAPGTTTVYRRTANGRLEALATLDAVDWARLVTVAQAA